MTLQALERRNGFSVAWALRQHFGPEPCLFLMIATFDSQRRQVAAGEMSIYPHIHAGELFWPA